MSKQPEALRLADALEDTDGAHDHEDAAAELRRLHEVNTDLLEACKAYSAWVEAENNHGETTFWERVEMCKNVDALMSAAIAKATGSAE